MATIFIAVALAVLVLNAVIMRSKTQWWRNPAALFNPAPLEEPELVQDPGRADPTRSADWVRAAEAKAAEMAQARAMAPLPVRPGREQRRAVDPGELAPRPPAEAPRGAAAPPVMSRPAGPEDEPTTEVFGRVYDEDEAPTQLLERIPAGYPDAHSMR